MAITLKTLRKTFDYMELKTVPTEDGMSRQYTKQAEVVGILAGATYRELQLGSQTDQAITHTLAQEGAPVANVRGRFVFKPDDQTRPDRTFDILRVENPGELDIYTLYYMEEIFD